MKCEGVVARFLPVILLGSMVFSIRPVIADTITFLDDSDQFFGLTTEGPRASSNLAFGGTFSVSANGVEFASWSYPAPINTTFVDFPEAVIQEPGTSFVSDSVNTTGIFVFADMLFERINFFSDSDTASGGGIGLCTTFGGCNIVEDGTIQTAFTITFKDFSGAVLGTDTIKFQSDIENAGSTPEPATLALLGIGLAGVGFSRRKRMH